MLKLGCNLTFIVKSGIVKSGIDKIADYWLRHAVTILLIGCLLTPLKLSLTYLFFGPAIFGWLCANRNNLSQKLEEFKWFFLPWGLFVFSLVFHSFFGFNPWRSLQNIYALLFYPVILIAIADNFKSFSALQPLLALASGQTLAGIHSVLDVASTASIPRLFIGAVTESGQLALVVPMVCGLAVSLHRLSRLKLNLFDQLRRAGFVALGSASLCLVSFSTELFEIPRTVSLAFALALLIVLFLIANLQSRAVSQIEFSSEKPIFQFALRFLESFFLPILFAALVINLKRGPWAGVIAALLIFALIHSRKLVLPFLVSVFTIIIFAIPVQTRLLDSSRDFFIPGGRSAIWKVGIELAERFPLGIGFRNSKYLHSFSAEIPAELTHFHNNLINILVECGPLTLILFLIWIYSIVKFSFRAKVDPILAPCAKAIGCSLVAWQVAGLVEYNFGDSEVVFIVYILSGALAGLTRVKA